MLHKDDCKTTYEKSCKKSYTTQVGQSEYYICYVPRYYGIETVIDSCQYEHEYTKKCHVHHEQTCHGYGYHKKCHVYPREECQQVPHCTLYTVQCTYCGQVPVKVPIKVPLEECHDIPRTYCKKIPFQVPHEKCKPIPEKNCIQVRLSIYVAH